MRRSTVTIPLSEGTGTYTETVTVAADRFRPAESAVAAQQVLGSADIQNLRGVLADDPLRAVQVLPGVATGDDLRSEFSVRGSQFSHMNVTVDGFSTPFLLHTVRAVEDASASGSVAMINSDVLEDVTLLNGGYAQRYGDRTGAEVDFRLREGSRERGQARIAVSGTSASLVLEGPLGGARRGSWLLSARQSYLDLVVDRIYEEGEGINFGFSDAQAKFVFDMTPSQRAELTLIAGRSKLEERREDLDADDLFTGRNASAIAIGTWRRTAPRGDPDGPSPRLPQPVQQSNHGPGEARRRTRRAGGGPSRRERHRRRRAAGRCGRAGGVDRPDPHAAAVHAGTLPGHQRFRRPRHPYRRIRAAAMDGGPADARAGRARRSLEPDGGGHDVAVAAGGVEAHRRRCRSAAVQASIVSSRISSR